MRVLFAGYLHGAMPVQVAGNEKHGTSAKISHPNAGAVLELFRCSNCHLVESYHEQ